MTVDELKATRDGTAAPAATAAYVYGVVRSAGAGPSQAIGIAGAEVRAVPFEDVAALVSEVPVPIRAKRRELMTHAQVLNDAISTGTVLPLRFGATFPHREAVVGEFLAPRHDELKSLLDELEGRVELMVKAFYREEAILSEIVRDNPRIARLRALTRDAPAAATHAVRLELGSAVAAALDARTRADAEAILGELRPFVLDVQVDETAVEHQVLRASILVARDDVQAVDVVMSALAERNAGRIHFKYVGPLAPHSFVSLSPGGSA
jgi:hypothetical protein